ncbi:MAG: multiprotein-bridging factor 1 family protein [Candidatus Micrarchaeota archaeon]
MECDICGKETNIIYVVEVEGAVMNVCAECSKGKKVIDKIDLSKQEKKVAKANEEKEKESEIIEHYGEAIRKAREKLGLPLNVLAERINEKESTLLRIEEEKTLPTDKIIKKLEKELGVKLLEEKKEEPTVHLKPDEPITLWDAAEKKEAKK